MERKIKGIAKDTLDFILEVSKSVYPNEFVGLLSADNSKGEEKELEVVEW